ncbi:MAG: cytochrome b/b6 domain-containing protein [Proteobacteria bacterium]|nr:cytochrome b/b6 domain-containing protein [Pseudomonadota bacterium]
MTRTPAQDSANATALVWDWPLRVFHWSLVLAVVGSFATHYAGIEWFDWHRRCGYVAVVLIGFRLAWGFMGPQYSRFASFLRGPRAVIEHLRGRQPYPIAGHNPVGAASVLAFLASLALQAGTGLFANDEIANAGPFYGWVTQETSNRLTALHDLNSSILIGLIVAHLVAIAWYDGRRRLGLVRAFWTGRKAGAQGIRSSRGGLALVIVVALIVALALAIRAAPEASVSFF